MKHKGLLHETSVKGDEKRKRHREQKAGAHIGVDASERRTCDQQSES